MELVDNTADFKPTPSTVKELLIGCGNNQKKQMAIPDTGNDWRGVITLDIDPGTNPDVLWDLNKLPLPFEDETFEEIHAYDVLEHVGQQGDYRTFFAQFTEFHRILKPGGYIVGATPLWDSLWAWGDPGHTRVFTEGTFIFLDQDKYNDEIGKTAMTDYRAIYKVSFGIEHCQEVNGRLCFVLIKK